MRALASSLLLASLAPSGCATHAEVVGHTVEGAPIVQIELPVSNAYLVQTRAPFLIDAGSEDDLPALEEALAGRGLRVEDLRAAVVTHAHFDHIGMARALQGRGVPIWLGKEDDPQARSGHNDELRPTSLMADVLKAILPSTFPPVAADVVIDGPVDLEPLGAAGFVAPMPGHTPGSLVVILEGRQAFVGDQMLGGILGGALCPSEPGEHYFQADLDRNRQNIRRLSAMGIETFFLGHGGPVTGDAVADAFGG